MAVFLCKSLITNGFSALRCFFASFAENSLNAAVSASASLPLKNTRHFGGVSRLYFLSAKSTPYFRATLWNDLMFWSFILILETPTPCFVNSLTVCYDILKRLNLMNSDRINNAGKVMFGDNANLEVQMATFATNERLTFLDIKRENSTIK